MTNTAHVNKSVSDQCQELQQAYPDVLEKWRRFGDPLQRMMVDIIDKNANKGSSA